TVVTDSHVVHRCSKAWDAGCTDVFALCIHQAPKAALFIIFLRYRLLCSLTAEESSPKIDGQLHTGVNYPVRFMDVINIHKTTENFHLLCDPRATLLSIKLVHGSQKHRDHLTLDVVHVQDANGYSFSTRFFNIFLIGGDTKSWISLAKR
ncbi:hypothetical protein J0S82_007936, partial [Galemys pyrenaicus]